MPKTKRDTMQPTMPLTADQSFFFEWSGYSHDPRTETPAQGRTRCAISMAAAEDLFMRASRVADVGITWEPDHDDSADGDVTPEVREQAYIWHRKESGDVDYLASLGGIQDADANYRRVIRAELASECEDQLTALIAAYMKGE